MGKGKGTLVNLMLLLLIAALYFATSRPDAAEAVAALSGAPRMRGHAEGRIALQFAMCWNAAAAEDILNTLSEKGTKVTFSVSGAWARENPALLRRMAEEGHELAVMGNDSAADGTVDFLVQDICAALEAVEELCGVSPKLYYSGQRHTGNSSRAARKLGLTHVRATKDLRSASGDAAAITARALEEPIAGSILLLMPTASAADALSAVIEGLQKKGLEAVHVGSVLGPE